MERFILSESSLGSFKTIKFRDAELKSELETALTGATILSFKREFNGETLNFIDGYQTEKELAELSGSRSAIMAPFTNRIKDGIYKFEGAQYKLPFINGKSMHGLLRNREFKLIKSETTKNEIRAVFHCADLRKNAFTGYPFDIDVYVKLAFNGEKIALEIEAENMGETPAPFGTGWHPYFKIGEESVDNLILSVPFKTFIKLDESYLPLAGKAAYKTIKKDDELNFTPSLKPEQREISARKINQCYADPIKNGSDFIETKLISYKQKLELSVYQERGVVYVFTGDGLKSRARKSVAIEPVEFITDSFNRTELKEELLIAPGKKKSFKFGIKLSKIK